jgi:hypothetical protein
VSTFLCFFLDNAHSAFSTSVGAFTFTALMIYNVHSLDLHSAVDARYKYVRADSLVFFDIPSDTLLFAFLESLTLCWSKLARDVVVLHFLVGENLLAAESLVVADKLHVFQLLLYLFLHVDEAGFIAEHRTLPCFFCKLVETDLVKSIVTFFALPRI